MAIDPFDSWGAASPAPSSRRKRSLAPTTGKVRATTSEACRSYRRGCAGDVFLSADLLLEPQSRCSATNRGIRSAPAGRALMPYGRGPSPGHAGREHGVGRVLWLALPRPPVWRVCRSVLATVPAAHGARRCSRCRTELKKWLSVNSGIDGAGAAYHHRSFMHRGPAATHAQNNIGIRSACGTRARMVR
jgi:hypothetical protein